MNKLVLLAVVCLLGTAAADTRFRRDILPGDARYNAGSSGYAYNQPQHHHHHVSVGTQPSRSYLQPVQEVKHVTRHERPSTGYLAPKAELPTYQIEQVRSVEHHSYTETSHQPSETYGAPSVEQEIRTPVVPHTTYGAPVHKVQNVQTYQPSAVIPQIKIQSAPVVPHTTYGAPQNVAPVVPHTTYGAPAANVQRYVAPAPVKQTYQTYTVQSAPKVAAPVKSSYTQAAVVPQTTYGAPAKKVYTAPAPSFQTTYSVPVKTQTRVEIPQTSYGTPVRSYDVPAQTHVVTYDAPAATQYHHSQSTVQVQQAEQLPSVQSNVNFRAPTQTYVPQAPAVEVETESVDTTYNQSHETSQPIGDNGGYVY